MSSFSKTDYAIIFAVMEVCILIISLTISFFKVDMLAVFISINVTLILVTCVLIVIILFMVLLVTPFIE